MTTAFLLGSILFCFSYSSSFPSAFSHSLLSICHFFSFVWYSLSNHYFLFTYCTFPTSVLAFFLCYFLIYSSSQREELNLEEMVGLCHCVTIFKMVFKVKNKVISRDFFSICFSLQEIDISSGLWQQHSTLVKIKQILYHPNGPYQKLIRQKTDTSLLAWLIFSCFFTSTSLKTFSGCPYNIAMWLKMIQ